MEAPSSAIPSSCASSPTTNHSRQVMDRLYRQRYSDPPLNERVLRAHGESRRRMPHLHSPPTGYHARSVDVAASTSLDHLASNCFDFPDHSRSIEPTSRTTTSDSGPSCLRSTSIRSVCRRWRSHEPSVTTDTSTPPGFLPMKKLATPGVATTVCSKAARGTRAPFSYSNAPLIRPLTEVMRRWAQPHGHGSSDIVTASTRS